MLPKLIAVINIAEQVEPSFVSPYFLQDISRNFKSRNLIKAVISNQESFHPRHVGIEGCMGRFYWKALSCGAMPSLHYHIGDTGWCTAVILCIQRATDVIGSGAEDQPGGVVRNLYVGTFDLATGVQLISVDFSD